MTFLVDENAIDSKLPKPGLQVGVVAGDLDKSDEYPLMAQTISLKNDALLLKLVSARQRMGHPLIDKNGIIRMETELLIKYSESLKWRKPVEITGCRVYIPANLIA